MQNEQHTTTSRHTGEKVFSRNKKRMGGWLNTCGFCISLAAMVFLLASFRIPTADLQGGATKNLRRQVRFTSTEIGRDSEKNERGTFTYRGESGTLRGRFLASLSASGGGETWRGAGGVDLNRLARAVAVAETSGCSRGTGITHLNCFGIRENGAFVKFDSHAASFESFKWNWTKSYGGFPTIEDARKWTGSDSAESWLSHVKANY